ncbi:hypothetical protein [Marinobacter piscensis]|uniref:hypothetical protein n=1 Tax=Marinobacter piscensis TaxID=1562308 RepID=UPI001C92C343|nr:hypothetical protein [Marinobacter piscensis]
MLWSCFSDLVVPHETLLDVGQAVSAREEVLALTLDYVPQRQTIGQRIADFQSTWFKLGGCMGADNLCRHI